jgi:endonuclease/exonuclease/phosphatase family metal-dependent hydrolase
MGKNRKKRKSPSELPDRLLKKLGHWLSDDDVRAGFLSKIRRVNRIFVRSISIGTALLLIFIILGFRFIGEKNLTFAFLLYLPRVAFLIPVAVFIPFTLLFCRKSFLLLVGSSLIFLFPGLGWRPGSEPVPEASIPGESLTVLTYNRGQHANQSLQPFKNRTDPDIIIFQEAGGRAERYRVAEGYEKYTHTLDEAEFTLLSRYPILGSNPIQLNSSLGSAPAAARFEIDFHGQKIVLLAVHTLSPRDTLLSYRRGAFLWGILGVPGTPFSRKREINQAYWDKRIEEMKELQKIIADDPHPTLVAGDFNAPSGGYIHRLLLEDLLDAHQHSGAGFGYTFPGTTRNPLSLGGPWMRIDYLFCDDKWEPTWCITEKERPSQHRAVTAQFRLLKSSQ